MQPWERGLRVRLGRWVTELTPGPYLVVPFVDQLYRQSVRRRLKLIPAQTLTTTDGKTFTIGGAVGFEIVDLATLYNTLHDADDTIEAEVSAIIAEYVGSHSSAECVPLDLEKKVRASLKLESYGLGAPEFFVTNFASAKTYRLITGEIKHWPKGTGLNTEIVKP